MVGHRSADHFPGGEVDDGSEIKPAFAGWNVGQIGKPYTVGGRRPKALSQEVRRGCKVMTAIGGARPE
jgi:hypothetical protein